MAGVYVAGMVHPPAVDTARSLGPLETLRVQRRLAHFAGDLTLTLARLRVELALHPSESGQARVRERTKLDTSARLLRIFGIEAHGQNTLPAHAGGRLVVANHRTAFDIGVLMSQFAGVMLSRGDLSSWPVIGTLAREGDTIFVDRESGHSGARAIRAIRRALSAGATVCVYPEGTTYVGDEVRPFLAGAFAAARGLDAQIVPVGLAYDHGVEYFHTTFTEHLRRVAARPTTRVVMKVGEPFLANAKSGELAAEAQRRVQGLVDQARSTHSALPVRCSNHARKQTTRETL